MDRASLVYKFGELAAFVDKPSIGDDFNRVYCPMDNDVVDSEILCVFNLVDIVRCEWIGNHSVS